ncbi:MAG TPA: hypothetical protein DCZ71_07615 [Ruminococcus sp.]|nr:hypothetical protein [Ruminococcus sp.]
MKDNLKIRAVLGDNDSTMLSELQVLLNEELSRDEGQRDYDYISELTLAIAEISGASLTDDEVERNIGSIMEEVSSREKRSHITVVRRVLSAVCSVALFFAAINCVTLASFGADVFSTFVKLTNGGFIIDFSNTENTGSGVVPAPVTEEAMPSEANNNTRPTAEGGVPGAVVQTDENVPTNYPTQAAAVIRPGVDGTNNSGEVPAGTEANVPSTKGTGGNSGGSGYVSVGRIMRERCSAQGLSPAAPPDEMEFNFTLEDYSYEQMEDSDDFYFVFSNEIQQLDVILEHYDSRYDMPELKIPSDNSDYSTENYPVGTVYLFEDNGINTALFVNNDTIYTIIGQNIDAASLSGIVAVFESGN